MSVASVQRMRETRLAASGGCPRRAMVPALRRKPRRVRPLAPWVRGCTVHAARERCECPEYARNAARCIRRRFLRMGCVVYPRIYAARCDAVWRGVFGTVYRGICPPWVRGCHGPAACARFRRGRRVPAPAARVMGAGLHRARRAPWVRGCPVHAARHGCGPAPCTPRVSVSSGLPPQETRLAAPTPARRRASRPHQPSEVWRAAALQSEIRIQRHARWIRWPCVSKASLRRPPPGEAGGKAAG